MTLSKLEIEDFTVPRRAMRSWEPSTKEADYPSSFASEEGLAFNQKRGLP